MAIFENPEDYPYKENDLLVGYYQNNNKWYPVGVKTEKHAVTIAPSGSGKGVAVLIPNLKKLKNKNILAIDPKGELASITANDRYLMKQNIYVVDPFKHSNVDKKFIASFNPLDNLNVNSITIREDIKVIADGIVMRHDAKHARWDNNALTIIAGLIAYVKTQRPPKEQNLIKVRDILITEDMEEIANKMLKFPSCGKLMQAAARAILTTDGEDFCQTARDNTEWLDSEAIESIITNSSFSLSELKQKDTSIYLVLPPDYLKEHGRFLRLFVRCAISQMMKRTPEGGERGKQCLFLLDEFYSLGKIEEIATSFGLMRSMGLQLWVFLQDLGQLIELYGREGSSTFFANSDLHQFFGNNDAETLNYISSALGVINALDLEEIDPFPKFNEKWYEQKIRGEDKKLRIDIWMRHIKPLEGKPRMTPDLVAKFIGKDKDIITDHVICFIQGRKRLAVYPLPYFTNKIISIQPEEKKSANDEKYRFPFKEIINNFSTIINPIKSIFIKLLYFYLFTALWAVIFKKILGLGEETAYIWFLLGIISTLVTIRWKNKKDNKKITFPSFKNDGKIDSIFMTFLKSWIIWALILGLYLFTVVNIGMPDIIVSLVKKHFLLGFLIVIIVMFWRRNRRKTSHI